MVAFIAIAAALYTFLRTLPGEGRMRGVFLRAATDKASGYVSAPDRDDLIGAEGVAETDLHPSGIATIDGERLDVVSEGGFIAQGSRVRVLHSDGYRHVVTRVEEIEPVSTA